MNSTGFELQPEVMSQLLDIATGIGVSALNILPYIIVAGLGVWAIFYIIKLIPGFFKGSVGETKSNKLVFGSKPMGYYKGSPKSSKPGRHTDDNYDTYYVDKSGNTYTERDYDMKYGN